MLQLRHQLRWRIASIVLLFLVLVAALAPVVWLWPDKVRMVSWIRGFDKWAHMLTFMVLALWFCGQHARRSYWRIALGLVLFGLFIEACQRMVGYRTADVMDMVANGVGIVIGLAIGFAWLGGWSQHLEEWYYRRAKRGVIE